MLIEDLTQYLKQLLETVRSLQGAIVNIETHAAISNSNTGKGEEDIQLTKEHFTLLADVIADKTTKFTVAFVENPASIDECKPFGFMLEQELVKLLSLASAVMLDNSRYCLSIKVQVKNSTSAIFQSVIELIEGVSSVVQKGPKPKIGGSTQSKSAPLTGIVWEACKELHKIELDNFLCLKQELLISRLPLIKDAVTELEELKSAAVRTEEDLDEIEDDEWKDLEDDVQLTESEKEVLNPCIILMKTTFSLIKKLTELMPFKIVEENENKEAISLANELSDIGKKAVEAVDHLGTSVYPPQTALFDAANSLIDIHKKLFAFTNKAVQHLEEKNRELTSKFLSLLQNKQAESLSQLTSLLSSRK